MVGSVGVSEDEGMQRLSSRSNLHQYPQHPVSHRSSRGHSSEDERQEDIITPAAVMRKIDSHLVPWFFALGIFCYLDRTNLSFAALQLNKDIGLSCASYGLGAGVFFLGYALCQVPSNMMLVRLGAPLWLGACIVAWGAVATAFTFTTGPTMFLLLRLALGVAECGAFPGMWYHLSLFYSESELGPAYAKVATSTALAQVIGAPLAAAILAMDGLGGLKGWQWLFILEGLPTILFGVALRLQLAPSPGKAKCLAPEERSWLQRRQDEVAAAAGGGGRGAHGGGSQARTVLRVMANWRVVYLGVVWLMIAATMYGIIFWCPLLINSMMTNGQGGAPGGHHDPCSAGPSEGSEGQDAPQQQQQQQQQHHSAVVALLTAVPFAVAAGGMVLNARLAQRANERHRHAGIPIILAGVFLGLVPPFMAHSWTAAAFVSLVLAAGCCWAFHGPFMSWPAVFLSGPEAAAGFAFINSLGALGGFAGPFMIGLLAGGSGGYGAAMGTLAVLLLLSGALILVFPERGRVELAISFLSELEGPFNPTASDSAYLNGESSSSSSTQPFQRSSEAEAEGGAGGASNPSLAPAPRFVEMHSAAQHERQPILSGHHPSA